MFIVLLTPWLSQVTFPLTKSILRLFYISFHAFLSPRYCVSDFVHKQPHVCSVNWILPP